MLSTFLAEQHEATIEAFVAADARIAELSKQIVRAESAVECPRRPTSARIPSGERCHTRSTGRPGTCLCASSSPHPDRAHQACALHDDEPTLDRAVSAPDAKPFDIVIFDEASQIAVWDAIGAIARGSQVVIVGDPQQLPPTSVGQRTDMDEDDGATVQSQQSILDECLASNLPSLRLDWHYRSRHESLIAFSNAKYYRGELVTFPSPFTPDTAVRLVPVIGGVYDRGNVEGQPQGGGSGRRGSRTAPKVVCGSIGIVTFNAEQQRVIENC